MSVSFTAFHVVWSSTVISPVRKPRLNPQLVPQVVFNPALPATNKPRKEKEAKERDKSEKKLDNNPNRNTKARPR